MFEEGVIVSKKAVDAVDEQQKFKMYYDYREPVKQIPSHRMLAIRRGETENVLYFLIELDPQRPLDLIKSKIHKQPGDWTPQLNLAAEDAWKRLLNSSITAEIRLELKQRADTDAIQVFRENLQNLLLAPPAGQLAVLGIDPGIRTGCKIAVVDDTGKFLGHDVIYPFQPKNDIAGAERTLKALIAKYNVRAIAIGNGTASRETDAFVRDFLQEGRPLVASSASPSTSPAPPSTPPPTSRARSSPTSTSPSAAPSPSRAACRTRWPNWSSSIPSPSASASISMTSIRTICTNRLRR